MAEIESAESFAERHHIVPGCVEPLREWGHAQREAGQPEECPGTLEGTLVILGCEGARGHLGQHHHFAADESWTEPEQPSSLVEQVTPMLGITDTDPSVDGYETAVLTLAERIDELTARVDELG